MLMRRVIPRPGVAVVVRAPVVAGTDPDERRWGSDCDGWRLGGHHTASRCEGDGREQQAQQTESVSHGLYPLPMRLRSKFRATQAVLFFRVLLNCVHS